MVARTASSIPVSDATIPWKTTDATDAADAAILVPIAAAPDASVPSDASIPTNATNAADARGRTGFA